MIARNVFSLFLLGLLLSSMPARSDTPAQFACKLKALTPSQRASHEQLTQRLLGGVLERRELADGLEFRMNSRTVSVVELATWTEAEHLCCPFLRLAIEQAPEPEGGAVYLRMTGPKGVKDFLLEEFGALAK